MTETEARQAARDGAPVVALLSTVGRQGTATAVGYLKRAAYGGVAWYVFVAAHDGDRIGPAGIPYPVDPSMVELADPSSLPVNAGAASALLAAYAVAVED